MAVAHEALERTPALDHPASLHVSVLAARGNAYRAVGNLVASNLDFTLARKKLHHDLIVDLDLLAEVDDLEGSLRKDRREFDEAEKMLLRAATIYRLLGEIQSAGKVRIKLAETFYYQGRVGDAIKEVKIAIEDLALTGSDFLYHCARFNLAMYLEGVGEAQAAEGLLEEDSVWREKNFSGTLKCRESRVLGMVKRSLGDVEGAENRYRPGTWVTVS